MIIVHNGKVTATKTEFNDEDELETVVKTHYKILFGDTAVWIDKGAITTGQGVKTITDGFVIDPVNRKWYIVEAELAKHSNFGDIIPQLSKQIVASLNTSTIAKLKEKFIDKYNNEQNVQTLFPPGVLPTSIPSIIEGILSQKPVLCIPVNTKEGIEDLLDWGSLLILDVSIIEIIKFNTSFGPQFLIPSVSEEIQNPVDDIRKRFGILGRSSRSEIDIKQLIDNSLLQIGESLYMNYKGKLFTVEVKDDGNLQYNGNIYTNPSTLVNEIMRDNGGPIRPSANGWDYLYQAGSEENGGRDMYICDMRDLITENIIPQVEN